MHYEPPKLYFNAHIETIFPAIFRKVDEISYSRERINTHDGDFLDLDWLKSGSKNLVIISHGLEGDSQRPYIKGMAKAFYSSQYDVLAWNYRGCSGEMNRKLRFYHSGETEDLQEVISHALTFGYENIFLIGFSLGGNITLKYLGEKKHTKDARLKGAVTFSVPLHLHNSCVTISKPSNFIYAQRFLTNLKEKVRSKAKVMPDKLNIEGLSKIKTLKDFDDRYTAPIHGFNDAIEYYSKCSSIHFLEEITTPTLIVNALNDPFLSDDCYPTSELEGHSFITFETPLKGGHVGFTSFKLNNLYWSELRALDFINSLKNLQ